MVLSIWFYVPLFICLLILYICTYYYDWSVIHCVPIISAWIPFPLVLLLLWSAPCSHSNPTYPCRHDLDCHNICVFSYLHVFLVLCLRSYVPLIMYLLYCLHCYYDRFGYTSVFHTQFLCTLNHVPFILCVFFIMTGSVILCVPLISAWISFPLALFPHWSAPCSHSYPYIRAGMTWMS